MLLLLFLSAVLVVVSIQPHVNAAPGSLPSFNIDVENVSVSGLSSGAFFATQMQVAYSSLIRGAGIISGGPYDCARSQSYSQCMYFGSPSIKKPISNTQAWSGVKIDDVSHMARQRVFIFSGTLDTTVSKSVTDQLLKYYVTEGKFLKSENVLYNYNTKAGHTFPTDFAATGNNLCTVSSSPYISDCGYDAAGKLLEHIYGPLQPRNDGKLTGEFFEFDQSEFLSNPTAHGFANSGWSYIPANCLAGQRCKLHVAFHGCQQSYSHVGDKFVKNTGYTRWADTNNIVLIFPQTTSTKTVTSDSLIKFANSNACYDWVGWYGDDFDTRSGKQMNAVKLMLTRVMGTNSSQPQPEVTTASGTTSTGAPVAVTTTMDNLITSAAYGTCYKANNFDHVRSGRAYTKLGYVYALGSNDLMGLYNVMVYTKLRQTGTSYYVVDSKC